MGTTVLGIDVGTSSCKAALFDETGAVIRQGKADYPVYYPEPGWAEQDPDEWWRGVAQAVSSLWDDGARPEDVAGIGIDGQSWSAIPVDASGNALCNTPIWMDTRAGDICEELSARIGAERLFQCSGNPVQPMYALPKILWYKRHRPEVYARAVKMLGANAYIAFRLTGAATLDRSQGYGINCFNMRRGVYDLDLCRDIGLDARLLPEIVACHQVVGVVTKEAAALTGLLPGTPVVAGGLDAACGTLGAGVLDPGETQEQGGQAGGMSICLSRPVADPRLILSYHVAPDRWLLQGGSVGGGGVLKWFEAELGAAERAEAASRGISSFEVLSEEAARVPAGSDGLVFLPYMAGERSPIWDARAKGVYYGLDYGKTRAHLVRAGMEGVAYALRHNLDVAEAAGARVQKLHAVGGAANSCVWTQIKADATGLPIAVPASDTATTLGAAILAGVGVGLFRDFEDARVKTRRIVREHTPDPSAKPAYDEGYRVYLQLYEQLKPIMHRN